MKPAIVQIAATTISVGLTLGIVFLFSGVVKFVGGLSGFVGTMNQHFSGKLPAGMVMPFAYVLPFGDVTVGALIVLGLFTRRHDVEARQRLGEACLMMNDLLVTEEQEERLNAAAGDREKVGDELMAQMLFQFELYHVPDVYQAVARNLEYFDIFEQRATEFRFSNDQTLPQKFATLTGLKLPQYLEMYFSIWTLHNSFQQGDPLAINENPSIINFDKEKVFALMNLDADLQKVFFSTTVSTVSALANGVTG